MPNSAIAVGHIPANDGLRRCLRHDLGRQTQKNRFGGAAPLCLQFIQIVVMIDASYPLAKHAIECGVPQLRCLTLRRFRWQSGCRCNVGR